MIKILITGDFAPRESVSELILHGDLPSLFSQVKILVDEADFAITNLETPLLRGGTPIAKTGPNLMADPNVLDALKYMGFDMVTLANNHIMDYGEEGLASTINSCKNAGIDYVGAGQNLDDAQRIKYREIKDMTIAFINVAENEWSTTHGEVSGAAPLDCILNYHQIMEAKRNADYAIMIVHGGHEMYGLPSPRMKRLYRWFIDLGADAVIGHHTHCFCGDEMYKNKPIIYSLGNFCFDRDGVSDSIWNRCVAAAISIENNALSINLIPLIQCNGTFKSHNTQLITIDDSFDYIKERELKRSIIADDQLLEAEFSKYVSIHRNLYLAYMEPIKNRYVSALIKRNIIPGFIRGKHKQLLLNIIRTESHRDVIIKLLNQKTI